MNKIDKKANYLALCLLESIEDKNIRDAKILLERGANPNTIIFDRDFASLHYSVGVEPPEFAEEMTKLLLSYGGDPNIKTDEGLTAVHISAIWGRSTIMKMLLEQGGDINIFDNDQKTPLQYAIHECHFDVIHAIQNFVFEKKTMSENVINNNNSFLMNSPNNKVQNPNLLSIKYPEATSKYTPNRINYNFDITSPYYINITHRKKDNQIKNNKTNQNNIQTNEDTNFNKTIDLITMNENECSNLFELTKDNLYEFTNLLKEKHNRLSLIKIWRDKVSLPRNRESLLNLFNNVDELLSEIDDSISIVHDDDGKTLTKTTILNNTYVKNITNDDDDKDIDKDDENDSCFLTAQDNFDESNYIKSPSTTKYIIQMSENYVHTDDEDGMIFYERKILPNPVISNTNIDLNESESSNNSTEYTIPLDYDTDLLKAELTIIGQTFGPITKTTKRLYLKKLIKFKRNPEKLNTIINNKNNCNNPKFSVEIERTFRGNLIENLPDVKKLEIQMIDYFKNPLQSRRWREGNLKTSFVYLLIDPTISDNLPGQYQLMTPENVWKTFLTSIFYVGKGKSSRPYAHLYDAMKYYLQMNEGKIFNQIGHINNDNDNNIDDTNKPDEETILFQSKIKDNLQKSVLQSSKQHKTIICSNKKKLMESKKLERILNIWKSQKGVVCLHLFHNIIPVEALTREAAIIDCLGLQHLTNLKRGDYYGATTSWTLRTRKYLGIGLLYRAMQMYLAEGESQLMPCDLI